MTKKLIIKTVFLLIASFAAFDLSPQAGQNRNGQDSTVTFYFTRHGKTMLNALDKVQGWSDSPLTEEGEEVARFLGKGLESERIVFDAAYSSDLGRARQTARIVLDANGQADLPLTEVPQMRETNFGSYEGDRNHSMWNDAALYMHFKSDKELFRKMDENSILLQEALKSVKALETMGVGEDFDDVKERGQKAIRQIAEAEAAAGGGNILVVGHGMSLSIFLSDIDSGGKKPNQTHMGNAAVSKVTYKDGAFTLESFGDMSYIEKGRLAHNE